MKVFVYSGHSLVDVTFNILEQASIISKYQYIAIKIFTEII